MLLVCYGTRPEWIKVKPIIDAIECKTLFTGQHKHLISHEADISLKIESESTNRLNSIFSSVMKQEGIFSEIDQVLVQGDTASAAAIALSAFHQKIKIIHLEAGLRTHNLENPYPEEAYRQIISRVANIHLCPTKYNKQCLEDEKVSGEIHVVGNTVLDNLVDLPISYNQEILVTMHRRENHPLIKEWFKEISKLAIDNPDLVFTLPIHPNPNVQKHKKLLKNVNVVNPIPYEEMKRRVASCRFLISDSGGLQEEASFLKKKIIVCRKTTERIESIGESSFICENPNKLEDLFNTIKKQYIIKDGYRCPYGDGKATQKIQKVLRVINE